MLPSYNYISTVPRDHIQRERSKVRQLKVSQWWRQQVGPGICYHCKGKFSVADLTMDHMVPLARGGRTVKGNVVPSCLPCNQERKALNDRPT